ncbi:hypothetical protein OZX72_00870 [Bifidobacterium sp. ESL0769]|uniref:hypothetical protein n=1 Tax=Bifidobacterium sp. ESL0769 TaxID=2983229 RepID=UPI0023FA0742|nr:hypothetical protein [Bifidobacterium sp. ESL0769]WEV67588.1 hypothetical protein OZX72_00870 [Bifidobacterium sp. ESL0769]
MILTILFTILLFLLVWGFLHFLYIRHWLSIPQTTAKQIPAEIERSFAVCGKTICEIHMGVRHLAVNCQNVAGKVAKLEQFGRCRNAASVGACRPADYPHGQDTKPLNNTQRPAGLRPRA